MAIDTRDLDKMWDELSSIPVDEKDCIQEPFRAWAKGSHKFIIWRWFDISYAHGLAQRLKERYI